MSYRSRQTTVLVVEDDPELRLLYRTVLAMDGYDVVALRDGIDALRHLESHRTDVVVLDLGLPRLGGRDVAREMSAHDDTRHIPIIVVTAADTPIGQEADYASVLRKPIEPEALAAVVAHSVKRHR